MRLFEPVINMRTSSGSGIPLDSARRTDALWSILQAARDFFEVYAKITLNSIGSISIVATAYMSFAFVTSSRILFLDDQDWDVSQARRSFDFIAACKTLGDRFNEADNLAQSLGRRRKLEDSDTTVLGAYHIKVMWIMHWYEARVSTALPRGVTNRGEIPNVVPSANSLGLSQGMAMGEQEVLVPGGLPPMAAELDENLLRVLLDWSGPLES
jgi:hypothetical protein